MARIYRRGVVAALVLAACGEATEPAGEWMVVGAAFALTAYFATDYDCAADGPGPAEPSICGGETGLVAMSRDTLTIIGTIDSTFAATFGLTGMASFSGTYAGCHFFSTFRESGCTTAEIASTAEIRRVSVGLCGEGVLGPCEPEESSPPVIFFSASVDLPADSGFGVALLLSFSGEADADGAGGTSTLSLGEPDPSSIPTFVPARQQVAVTWRMDVQ